MALIVIVALWLLFRLRKSAISLQKIVPLFLYVAENEKQSQTCRKSAINLKKILSKIQEKDKMK